MHTLHRTQIAILAVFAFGTSCARSQTTPVIDIARPFTVDVRLSSPAASRLASAHESIVVRAYFYGFPTETAKRYADEMGEIHLGEAQIELPSPGAAHFSNATYDRSKLRLLKDQDLQLLINVYSGRHSYPDNLLNCTTFEAPFRSVDHHISVDCSLIDERGV